MHMSRTRASGGVGRTVAILALAAMLVLAGCSGGGTGTNGGGDGGSAEVAQSGGSAEEATAAAEATAADGAGADAAAKRGASASASANGFAASRARIRLGTVALEVEEYGATRRNLSAAAREYGGFVSDSNEEVHERGNATWTTGTLVVRVPRENFSAMMDRAKAAGRVQSSNTETKDVTEQVVDTEARLENLRSERERLRDLYESANSTEDVLAVQERLSEVQGEIERLEARLRSLRNRIAYSTITIQLREEPPEPDPGPEPPAWYDTPVVTAFLDSVSGVVTTLRAAVVAAAYAAPYALVFGVPAIGLAVVARRRLG
jgi:hypothetical protein